MTAFFPEINQFRPICIDDLHFRRTVYENGHFENSFFIYHADNRTLQVFPYSDAYLMGKWTIGFSFPKKTGTFRYLMNKGNVSKDDGQQQIT